MREERKRERGERDREEREKERERGRERGERAVFQSVPLNSVLNKLPFYFTFPRGTLSSLFMQVSVIINPISSCGTVD